MLLNKGGYVLWKWNWYEMRCVRPNDPSLIANLLRQTVSKH